MTSRIVNEHKNENDLTNEDNTKNEEDTNSINSKIMKMTIG